MKFKHLFFFGFIIFSLTPFVQAQRTSSDNYNFKKYWWYHYRLVNDFLVKGDCKGCSEPMNERAAFYPLEPPIKGKWGDQTISLGMYMGVLATEYRLLRNAGQPTDTTVQELYYALKAFERLDRNAESFYRCRTCPASPEAQDLNGFFIRDDVDENFLKNHPTFAQGVTSTHIIKDIDSDFMADKITTNEESHDQVWHLFMGTALITKLVDATENYNGMHVAQEAKDITDRMINYIRSNNWIVKNPITGAHVSRGDDVWDFSYGAAEAACFIKDGNSNQDWNFPQYPINTCKQYHDGTSYADAIPWNELGKPVGALYAFSDEDYKPQVLAAIGHSWYTSMFPVIPNPVAFLVSIFNVNNLLHPWSIITQAATLTPILPVNVTEFELGQRAILRDWQHLPLLHQVLHGGTNPVPRSTYYDLLDAAPCEGPYNFGYPNNSASFEWSTDNRMLSPDRRGEWTNTTPYIKDGQLFYHYAGDDIVAPFYGEYNGLDYMLYYNLFALAQGTTGTSYSNYMNRRITYPFPVNYLGTKSNPTTVEAFNSIEASNIVNSTAAVDYHAGREIHLEPGFHAAAGCDFHAYIKPFECANGTYRRPVSSNDSSSDNMNYVVAYEGPTTFVNYPKEKTYNEEAPAAAAQNNAITSAPNNASPVAVQAKVSDIRIQPNPNSGSFEVIVPNNEKVNARLTLLSIFGTILLQQQLTSAVTLIDISGQAKGIYYIRMENEQGVKMEKIVYQ